MTSWLKIEFAEADDFVQELEDRKAFIQHPVRIATHGLPPGATGGGPLFVTKAAVPIGQELLELTLVSGGEASAEQAERGLIIRLADEHEFDVTDDQVEESLDLDVRTGSRYEAA